MNKMDHNDIRKFFADNKITAYEISKETGLSTTGATYFLTGDTRPRKKTLDLLTNYMEKVQELSYANKKEDFDYKKIGKFDKVTNKQLLEAIQTLTDVIGDNGSLVTDLLARTYNNTKKILIKTNTINDEKLRDINQLLKEMQND
jgi:hypothetical protein